MSEDNVELARRAIDAVNRRDLDDFLALMDDDVEAVSRIVALERTGYLSGEEIEALRPSTPIGKKELCSIFT